MAKKSGTRVVKKGSLSGKITVYLGKRDFVNHVTHVDPIEGVVLIDPDYMKDKKVYGHVQAQLTHGSDDPRMFASFLQKLVVDESAVIYPPDPTLKRPTTHLQERLIKKLGVNAHPFYFELPTHCPLSVSVLRWPDDNGKPNGVQYEMKAFVKDNKEKKVHKINSVRIAIRLIVYAPSKTREPPSVDMGKIIMMWPSKLYLECSLDKELYHHGESLNVNINIKNISNKVVKKIKATVLQFVDINGIDKNDEYKCIIAELERIQDLPLGYGKTYSCVLILTPLVGFCYGLALDGKLKGVGTDFASSTPVPEEEIDRELVAVNVRYMVKVKLYMAPLGGEVVAELPFTLRHPRPKDPKFPTNKNPIRTIMPESLKSDSSKQDVEKLNQGSLSSKNTNLIQLETADQDDDIIFEDFARFRLKGEEAESRTF